MQVEKQECPEVSNTIGYCAPDAHSPLRPFAFERRALRPEDVRIEIRYCGVCHTDLHQARNDWHRTTYPIVPGHEIVGHVVAAGSKVTKFAVGDAVAVGCMVDSCLDCPSCHSGNEQYCLRGQTETYNGKDRLTGEPTYGGYSQQIVVRENFVLKVPGGLDLERTAPLLCAGIATYTPLKTWNVAAGHKIAVVGLGGLGHMGVKLASGLGAEVTVISTSPSKAEDARRLGAHDVLLSSDANAMHAASQRFDFILDTVPVVHELDPYLRLLKLDATLVLVGAVDMIPSFHSGLLLGGRRRLAGSAIGGIAQTQDLLDFCAAQGILPDCETIAIQQINDAFERMKRNDVKYRFVIDMKSLGREHQAAP
jgi:uncharacterized zinc-type alcohol dehydrogenase-like protein